MEITIDTSALIAVCLDEPVRADLVAKTLDVNLIAPESVHWEIGNALSAMLKRQRINLQQAQQGLDLYRQIPIRLVPVDLKGALEYVERFGLYAYDAYLLVCAVKQHTPLLTLDKGLKKAAQQLGINLLEQTT
jgi:predicted nucleic acid-binding protein